MAPGEASDKDASDEQPPAPPELVARAGALMARYPEYFWFWRTDARIRSVDDGRLVVRHLREYGDRDAWLAAQDLARCLSQPSRRTPQPFSRPTARRRATLADERPDIPIGIAFVDAAGSPGWIGADPALRMHAPTVRGCWPEVRLDQG